MNLIDKTKIIDAVTPATLSGDTTGDYIDMKQYGHATIILETGASFSGTASVLEATDTSGSSASTLTDITVYEIAVGDDSPASVTVTNGEFSAGASKTYIIEVKAASLDTDNSKTCIALFIDTASGPGSAVAILTDPRYVEGTNTPSAI